MDLGELAKMMVNEKRKVRRKMVFGNVFCGKSVRQGGFGNKLG